MSWNTIQYNLRCITPPSQSTLPVTLEEMKQQIGVLDDDSINAELRRICRAVTQQVEKDARRIIMTQTWRYTADRFPCGVIELRVAPIPSVSSVKYTINSVLTTLPTSVYETDLVSEPARLRPKSGQSWPVTDCAFNAVQIEFVAGYGDASDVPDDVKDVILRAFKARYFNCDLGEDYWDMIAGIKTFGFVV